MITEWMKSTEKDNFEKLKRSIFNCTPIIEKMIWKIEIAPNISDLNPGQFTIKNN